MTGTTYHRNTRNTYDNNALLVLDYLRSTQPTPNINEVARNFGIQWMTARKHLFRLQAKGLIEFVAVTHSRNGTVIRVTPAGMALQIEHARNVQYTRANRKQRGPYKKADTWVNPLAGMTEAERIEAIFRRDCERRLAPTEAR